MTPGNATSTRDFDTRKRRENTATRAAWRSGFGEQTRQVVNHPGFIELSCWPDLREPWAVGMRLGETSRINWFHGCTIQEVIHRALLGIELLSSEAA